MVIYAIWQTSQHVILWYIYSPSQSQLVSTHKLPQPQDPAATPISTHLTKQKTLALSHVSYAHSTPPFAFARPISCIKSIPARQAASDRLLSKTCILVELPLAMTRERFAEHLRPGAALMAPAYDSFRPVPRYRPELLSKMRCCPFCSYSCLQRVS